MLDTLEKVDAKPRVTNIEEVNRLLDIGRLLRSVLTDEEIRELTAFLNGDYPSFSLRESACSQIGTTHST